MNILDRIAAYKKQEVAQRQKAAPIALLEQMPLYSRSGVSLKKGLRSKEYGIIAEHKRRSPSKAEINFGLKLADVVKGYEAAGAAGISVAESTQAVV